MNRPLRGKGRAGPCNLLFPSETLATGCRYNLLLEDNTATVDHPICRCVNWCRDEIASLRTDRFFAIHQCVAKAANMLCVGKHRCRLPWLAYRPVSSEILHSPDVTVLRCEARLRIHGDVAIQQVRTLSGRFNTVEAIDHELARRSEVSNTTANKENIVPILYILQHERWGASLLGNALSSQIRHVWETSL